jgi:predicted CopG family antitoxin
MFRLSTPKKEAFLNKVKQDGKKASEVLIWLIDKYLEDLADLTESKPGRELEEVKSLIERHELEIQFLKRELLGELSA